MAVYDRAAMNTGVAILLATAAILIAVCASRDESKELMLEGIKECMKEHNISHKDMDSIKKQNFTEERYKCFSTCIGEKLELLNGTGEFDKEQAKNLSSTFYLSEADRRSAKEVINDCYEELKLKSPQGCDLGPVLTACLYRGAVEKMILPKSFQEMLEEKKSS